METKVKPTVETWLCRGYLFLMLALLPLAVHNGFFDITETKTICFTVPTVVFVLVRLGFTLYRENGLPRRRLAGAEWAALALCLICFIASAAGGDFAGSFLGERGRYQGLGMMWLYAALYFAFSGVRMRSGDVLVPLGLGLFLSGALTVCNHLGYDALRRYPLLLAGTALSVLAYRAVVYDFGKRLSSLGRHFSEPAVMLPLAVLGAAVYFLLRKRENKTLLLVRKIYAYILLGAAVLAAVVLVLLNTVWSAVPLGGMDDWLHFSDAWGTDRVGVWKYCLSLFGDFPFGKKLIGGGCGVLAALDVQHRYFPDAILDAAHCEYIQLLLNWGVLGLGAYLAWIVLALRRAWKKGGALAFALAAGLLGYGVQALVNIAQAPGISLFFVLLAVLRGQNDAEELTCG